MNRHRWTSQKVRQLLERTRGKSSRRGGFTLIEVTIAVMLLLISTSGIVPLYLTTLNQSSTVRYKSLATNIAREKMEEIRQLDYREIISPEQLAERFGSSATERGIAFAIDYDVNVTTYSNDVLKEVTVNVSWTAPPAVETASASTLVHQQFLGPRGGRLTVTPTTSTDPLGTPFLMTSWITVVRYYVAEADWNLIFGDVTNPADTYLGAYARFRLYDDNGVCVELGNPANDYKLDSSYLFYSTDSEGALTEVRYRLPFLDLTIPDGYWELRAVVYNKYDQPGNVWRLRIRVENSEPAAPTTFTAVPVATDAAGTEYSGLDLYWQPGEERDRKSWLLERSINGGSWESLGELDPDVTTYHDPDPWGDTTHTNTYEYRIKANDLDFVLNPLTHPWGGTATCSVLVPPVTPTTTTTTTTDPTATTTSSTTTSSTTTTTLAAYPVTVDNNTKYTYTVTIVDSEGNTVATLSIKKNKTENLSLPAGTYNITASSSGQPTRTGTFTLPPPNPNDTLVLQILSIGG